MGVEATPQDNRFPADRITTLPQCGQPFFRRDDGKERTGRPWGRLPSPLQIPYGLVDATYLLRVSG